MSTKIVITNISPQLDRSHLVDLFSCCGPVKNAILQNNANERVCIIEYAEADHAKAASCLSGTPLGEKKLSVSLVPPVHTPLSTPQPAQPVTGSQPVLPTPAPMGNGGMANGMANQQNAMMGNQMNQMNPMMMNPMMMNMNPMMMNPMMMQQRAMMMQMQQMHAMQQKAAMMNNPVAAAAASSGANSPPMSVPPPMVAAIQNRAEEVARTIYVGNLNPMIKDNHLRQFFSACGEINHVKVVGDSSQRHGFIEFKLLSSVATAMSLNGTQLGDRVIKVNHANNPIVKDTTETKKLQDALEMVKKAQEAISQKVGGAKSKCGSRCRSRSSSSGK
jgi:hypothetical protein